MVNPETHPTIRSIVGCVEMFVVSEKFVPMAHVQQVQAQPIAMAYPSIQTITKVTVANADFLVMVNLAEAEGASQHVEALAQA